MQAEIVYWQTVKESKDPEMYNAYLKAYPEGQFAELARLLHDRYASANKNDRKLKNAALLAWRLEGDAEYFRSIIAGQTQRAMANWPDIMLSASYYKLDKGHSVSWLQENERYMRSKEDVWREGAPDIGKICSLGKELGVDVILIGNMRAKRKWSDQFRLGYVNTWMVDIRTGTAVHEMNKSSWIVPREELINIIDRTVATFNQQVIASKP